MRMVRPSTRMDTPSFPTRPAYGVWMAYLASRGINGSDESLTRCRFIADGVGRPSGTRQLCQ
jgi:hypothetical protein